MPTVRPFASSRKIDAFDRVAALIVRHDVTPGEVERAFLNDPMYLRAEVVDGEERYTGVGYTDRLRALLAWTMRKAAIRPITASNASERLAKRHFAERGF